MTELCPKTALEIYIAGLVIGVLVGAVLGAALRWLLAEGNRIEIGMTHNVRSGDLDEHTEFPDYVRPAKREPDQT